MYVYHFERTIRQAYRKLVVLRIYVKSAKPLSMICLLADIYSNIRIFYRIKGRKEPPAYVRDRSSEQKGYTDYQGDVGYLDGTKLLHFIVSLSLAT